MAGQETDNPSTHVVPDPVALATQQRIESQQAERDYVDGQVDILEAKRRGEIDSLDAKYAGETGALEAKLNGEVGILAQRLDDIDRATEVLNAIVTRVPTDVQKEVAHLRELSYEKFNSIEQQFRERDIRSEREARDNKTAVDAAFAAQKEAAAAQNDSNTLAIGKSETATNETINKLAELFKTTTDGLGDKIEGVKERISEVSAQLESVRAVAEAARNTKTDQRLNVGMVVGILGLVGMFAGVAVAVAVALSR